MLNYNRYEYNPTTPQGKTTEIAMSKQAAHFDRPIYIWHHVNEFIQMKGKYHEKNKVSGMLRLFLGM